MSEISRGMMITTMTSYWRGKKFDNEHRSKISKTAKGKAGYWKGKHFTKSHCKNISDALKRYEFSDIHRENVSRGVRNWWSKPENREIMSKAHDGPGHSGGKGWHQTESAKEKIRQARLGKPHPYKRSTERGWKISEEGKENMSKAHKRRWLVLKKENPDRYKEIRKHMSEGQKRRYSNKTGEKSE